MILKSDYGNDVFEPRETDITKFLRELEDSQHSYVILEKDSDTFIQTTGSNKSGYVIEYQEEGVHSHILSGKKFSIEQVINIFRLYLNNDGNWKIEVDANMSRLNSAFGFTDEELLVNKQNILSERQKETIKKHYKGRNFGILIALVAVISSLIFFAIMIYTSFDTDSREFKESFPYFILAGTVFTGIFLFFILLSLIKSRDLRKGRISYEEGIISRADNIPSKSRLSEFVIRIGKTYFIFYNPAEYYAFENGKRYGIYFVRNNKFNIILSAEELPYSEAD